MALLGLSESLGQRGIQVDLKVGVAAKAGILFMLGSGEGYVQLASQSITHVLDAEVDATGLVAADVVFGTEVRKTQVNKPALLRPLMVGDTFQVNAEALASGSATGAIDGSVVPNTKLGVDPATGKIRQKQTTDIELLRLASDGGNTFDTDGSIWVEVVALS